MKKKKPEYVPEASQENVPDASAKEIGEIVTKIAILQGAKAELESEVKTIGLQIQTQKELLVDMMESSGLTEFKTKDGVKARVDLRITGKIVDPMAFYLFLKERNEESLVNVELGGSNFENFRDWYQEHSGRDLRSDEVSMTCHHKRLSAWLKEQEDEMVDGVEVATFPLVYVR